MLMKKIALSYTAIALVSCFIIASCSRDAVNDNTDSNTAKISQGSWTFKSAESAGIDVSNDVAYFDPCQKDNVFDFSASGTGTMSEGSTKCDPSDPNAVPFTWNFQNGETKLAVSINFFSHGSLLFDVVSLNANEMILSQAFLIGPSVKTVKITFQH
jgi:hypothetical protein